MGPINYGVQLIQAGTHQIWQKGDGKREEMEEKRWNMEALFKASILNGMYRQSPIFLLLTKRLF